MCRCICNLSFWAVNISIRIYRFVYIQNFNTLANMKTDLHFIFTLSQMITHTDSECTFLYISTNVGTHLEFFFFFTFTNAHTHTLMQTAAASLKVLVRLCEAQWISFVRGSIKGMKGIEWLTIQYILIRLHLCTNNIAVFEEMHLCNKGQNDKAEIKRS